MALTLDIKSDRVVSLEEYTAFINEKVDLDDVDSVLSSATLFKGLLNNRALLTERLNDELARARDYQRSNTYSGPVTILDATDRYIIRANIWEPVRKYDQDWVTDNGAYSYLNVHDHNFSFMTGGYLGEGYSTTIWEWDGLTLDPEPGQRVDMRFLEHTMLPEGKIMYYRESTDLHRQEHAQQFSVSLNLLIRPAIAARSQYRFDPETSTVNSTTAAEIATRHTLCQIAPLLGNADSIQLLFDITKAHTDPNFRASAMVALKKAHAIDDDGLASLITSDKDSRVGALVRTRATHA